MPWGNMPDYYNFSLNNAGFFLWPLLIPTVIWSLFWKGLALYRAARSGQKGWFVALLVLNTLGILEIVYLLIFSTPPKKPAGKKRA